MSTLELDEPDVAEAAKEGRARRRKVIRATISFAILAVVTVVLWPAQYGGWTGLTIVNGHSMEPTYHTGDLVVSLREPSYQPGEIVSYLVPKGQPGAGGRVIHRILSVNTSGVYTTQGDNNTSTDPWHFRAGDVLGTAVFMIPGVGSWFSYVTNPLVIGLLAGLTATVTIWRLGRGPSRKKSRTPRRH